MPLISLPEAANKTFDYIIIGGGTSGLTLAARLTENTTSSVLVLEAGGTNFDDPAILRPGQYGSHFGQPAYDWGFMTTPQEFSNGTQFYWARGKGLGGSSQINFSAWNTPPKEDINDWEKLGNPGWNWDDFAKYTARASTYVPLKLTSEEETRRGAAALKGWDKPSGTGPVKVSHPLTMLDVDAKVQQTLLNLGIPWAPAPLHGDPSGAFLALNNLDPVTHTRSYSTTAYYTPNASRPNLNVLVEASVSRLITTTAEDGEIVATGVEFIHGTDKAVHIAHARKEVILSAGTLKSPQILELSGIGRRDVLDKIGVPVKLELEGVGENIQEHIWAGVAFQLKEGLPDETYDVLREPGQAERHLDLYAQEQGAFTLGIINFTFQPLDNISPNALAIHEATRVEIEQGIKAGKYSEGLTEQYRIQLERFERKSPGCEIIGFPGLLSYPNPPLPGKRYFTMVTATNHMFARGTVHATSADPTKPPAIDPRYFEHDIDLKTLVELVKFARKLPETEPFKNYVDSPVVELNPGPEAKTDADIEKWLKGWINTTYHTVGSLSMLPRRKGGVVDPRLKVYGTKNIRVVDVSVAPLHFASHPQVFGYVVGEKAADIIKGVI